jgi:hypothetical protein
MQKYERRKHFFIIASQTIKYNKISIHCKTKWNITHIKKCNKSYLFNISSSTWVLFLVNLHAFRWRKHVTNISVLKFHLLFHFASYQPKTRLSTYLFTCLLARSTPQPHSSKFVLECLFVIFSFSHFYRCDICKQTIGWPFSVFSNSM